MNLLLGVAWSVSFDCSVATRIISDVEPRYPKVLRRRLSKLKRAQDTRMQDMQHPFAGISLQRALLASLSPLFPEEDLREISCSSGN